MLEGTLVSVGPGEVELSTNLDHLHQNLCENTGSLLPLKALTYCWGSLQQLYPSYVQHLSSDTPLHAVQMRQSFSSL